MVSLIAWLEGAASTTALLALVATQIIASFAGVALAHAMFDLALWAPAVKPRTGPGQWLAEGVATFGLVLTIMGTRRYGTVVIAAAVATYICAAYWFTASTSFANPAVAIARSLTNTFSGIRPDVPAFIGAELVGAVAGLALMSWLLQPTVACKKPRPD